MPRNWAPHIKVSIGVILVGVTLFILNAAANGIIGNRADALFLHLWEWATAYIPMTSWPWIITLVAWLVLVLIAWAWGRDRQAIGTRLKETRSLFEIDESLLRLLPNLVSAQDQNQEVHKIIQKFLYQITQMFSKNVERVLFLHPDPTQEYLVIWVYYGRWLDEANKQTKKFYIGPHDDTRKRGVAGEAFCTSKTIIAHIKMENGNCKSDKESCYISFDGEEPSYRSLACIPIIAGGKLDDRLGVLCMDSKNPSIFDDPVSEEILELLGRQIAAMLKIYEELQKLHPRVYTRQP
jgi:putative methionine-R-sulfoxide reductase with GAF domain